MEAYYNYGNTLLGKGKYDEAIVQYDEAIRLDPGFSRAYLSKALVYEARGDFSAAYKAYQQFLQYASPDFDPFLLDMINEKIKEHAGTTAVESLAQ